VAASPFAVRGLTLLAAAFLGFDGAALMALGVWSGRWWLVIGGSVLFFGAGLVLLYGRRQQRRLAEIAAARQDLRDETEALRRFLER
jgi:hypothetical protein